MSKNYQWPLYGIDIPPGLQQSETKTYHIYKSPCGDLENCVKNSHYTIPRIECSQRDGIILPHYTTFNKNTKKTERTYYFPENIEDPNMCDNMINYTSKIARDDKICDSANNSCYIKMSRDDIPDVFIQVFEIIDELEKVFEHLIEYCESSNIKRNEFLEKRINNIILSYDYNRQNSLYTASDTYLNIDYESTKEFFKQFRTQLIIDRAEYSNKNGYKEYIKSVLIDKYIFLSHFIENIINQRVDISKEVAKIRALEQCVADEQESSIEISKGKFNVLAQPDSDEGSPQAVLEQGVSASGKEAVVLDDQLNQGKLSKLLVKPTRDQHEEQLLEQIVQDQKKMIKQSVQEILEYNIDEAYVLDYINTQPISIEIIYNIRNKCDELLHLNEHIESNSSKVEKSIISRENKERIYITRDLTNILEIYFGYPFYPVIIESLINLTAYQLEFLTKYFYKFDNKFYLNFMRGIEMVQNKEEVINALYNRIEYSLFYDKICYLISFNLISAYHDKIIDNIKKGLTPLNTISQVNLNIINKILPIYITTKHRLNTYDINSGLLNILMDFPYHILQYNIDNTLLDVKNNPYDILSLPHDTKYEQIGLKILDIVKNNPQLPNLKEARALLGTQKKRIDFDTKIQQQKSMVMLFCTQIVYIINHMFSNIILHHYPYFGLLSFPINEIIVISEKYSKEILCPLLINKITFFITIQKQIKLINNEKIEKTNQEIFNELRDYINQPYEFSDEFNIYITYLNMNLNVLITTDNINNMNEHNSQREVLIQQLKQEYEALSIYRKEYKKQIENIV